MHRHLLAGMRLYLLLIAACCLLSTHMQRDDDTDGDDVTCIF